MAVTEKKKPLITPIARLSYPAIFQPRAMEEGKEKMYSCALLFDAEAQKTPEFVAMKKAAEATAREKWGDKMPSNLRTPFRNGAEKDGDGYGEGVIFINISSKQKPNVIDARKESVEDDSEVYAGCYVRASVRPYAYDAKGNRGVSFGLQNIQKLKDGAPLGNRTRAQDDFDAVEADETESGESADSLFG